ncbi:MAG: hypothetical protein AB1679_14945 [Actinomycetota bacterium]
MDGREGHRERPVVPGREILGRERLRGRIGNVTGIARVNGWSMSDAEAYAEAAFEQWAARSRHDWVLDCSVLEALGVRVGPPVSSPAGEPPGSTS